MDIREKHSSLGVCLPAWKNIGVRLVLILIVLDPPAISQTRQFLDAPIVRSEVSVRWNASAKTLQWEADEIAPFRSIQSDTLFLAKDSIYVTYPFLNPLSVQATASATAVEDPAYSTITKLINAITTVGTTVVPSAASVPSQVADTRILATCSNATNDLINLHDALYPSGSSATSVSTRVKAWIKAIDDAFNAGNHGPQAIAAGVEAIRNDVDSVFGKNVDAAQRGWDGIKNCAINATDPTQKAAYTTASLNDQTPRIQQLTALKSSATQLADLLENQFAAASKWMGRTQTDYVISDEIRPTFDKMQNVTVKIVSVALNVESTTGVLSTQQQPAGSATFSVRHYASLTPEIGVGAVFGTIKQPKYGTSTNATGQTIVTKVPDTSISVNPTILVNFVCRCGSGLLVPMLQVGAATSKTLPAILIGGGVRLFGLGKGDVAIGGGGMFAWYKDLQKLKVGDVISGTTSIDADLGFASRPKVGAYVAIQYKF